MVELDAMCDGVEYWTRAMPKAGRRIALRTRCEREVRGLDRARASCFIVTVPNFPRARTPCPNPTWSLFHFGEPAALRLTLGHFRGLFAGR